MAAYSPPPGHLLPPSSTTTTGHFLPSMPAILRFLGWDDARLYPSDWSLTTNPFWTTFLFSLILFPCLFYTTWYFNPSLSRNRLGLSWVLGFYSALFFTIAGFYEVPHLRTVFNAAVDYQPSVTSVLSLGYGEIATTGTGTGTDVSLGLTAAAGAVAAARQICYPILTAGALALLPTLPSFMKLDLSSTTPDKYYCFSDLPTSDATNTLQDTSARAITNLIETGKYGFRSLLGSFFLDGSNFSRQLQQQLVQVWHQHEHGYHHPLVQYGHPIPPQRYFFHPTVESTNRPSSTASKEQTHRHQQQQGRHKQYQQRQQNQQKQQQEPSLRHRIFQGQMKRPHLLFSLENYPDDGRIGPHIIAANFQAFLVCDLILGAIHYRRQLEPFSTVVHHIIYFFIVVHMRAGDMLSVFCILGTPIEASSIFLAYGRMFPHLRTPTIERLYLTCFITTRLGYVSLLWHEVYYNYPDKSVAFLYTITLSLHVYWFVLYIQTQRRFAEKQRRQQLCTVLTAMANALKEEFVASAAESAGISSTDVFGVPGKLMDKEAHVKDGEQDPLLDQSTAKKRKEGEDMLLPQPDSNVSHRVRRRSEPQV
ncbi:hypothetical protein BKA57DRAFT_503530 [Linnemannia elongata]|nr:hypothetical protein BKA57DRAFT_503530 [Linnemannia elongata]